jgi:Sulfatase
MADNGASQEGGPFGVMHEMKFFNGILESPEQAIGRIDDIGGPHSHTNYPWGWAQCGNSPFRWYKQNTHEGGVHVPMIVHWPTGIDPSHGGGLRHQFVNVSDVAPTIYELLGVTPPATRLGVDQLPITGHSFVSVLHDPDAHATNRLQYFENAGSRALIVEQDSRWFKAVARHQQGVEFESDVWELYDLSVDASECDDIASAQPARLAALIELWWQEAERHGVLPLDDRTLELFAPHLDDRSPHRPDRRYVYRPPMSPIPAQASAPVGGRSFDLIADVTLSDGDEGVIWSTGNENSGVAVFVQGSRLVVDYNAFGDHTIVESVDGLPVGRCTLGVHLERDARTTGFVELAVDGRAAGRGTIGFYMRMVSSSGSSVGLDHGSAVSARYEPPFEFTGTLHEVVIQLARPRLPIGEDHATIARHQMSQQ